MPEDTMRSSKRVLDPIERSSEVLFGLIMVLTLTNSISAAQSGQAEVRTMIAGALGCNLAWGVIDGLMYLMAALSEKGHNTSALEDVRLSATAEAAHDAIRRHLPPLIAADMETAQLEHIRLNLLRLPRFGRPRLTLHDWRGATGVFLLVFLSTFPSVIPFLLVPNVLKALRISNLIAIVMLGMTGYSYGHYSRQREWVWALSMIAVGCAMVSLTIALGG